MDQRVLRTISVFSMQEEKENDSYYLSFTMQWMSAEWSLLYISTTVLAKTASYP